MWYSLILAAGIILLTVSLLVLKKSITFLRTSERAIATVIDLEKIHDSDGDTFKPVFTFKTLTNVEIIHRHISSSNPPAWKIGEEVTIAYDQNDPSTVRVLTYFGTFSWTIILMAIAMPLIVIGGGYHVSQAILR